MAKNGLGTTYPNPIVGSVVVYNNKIIGEGWHKKAGEPHAEVLAIKSVKDKSLLKSATIYVSLEPCSHVGKTPPCANLIVESGIKNVVIGVIDANDKVSGRGVEHLKNNNCNVIVGVLEKECLELNKRFFTFHTKKRPYIILKWAETKDGFIDKLRGSNAENSPNWISSKFSQQLVHKLRSEEQAILVGTNTAINDNPKLNVRSFLGNNPTRIVLDKTLKIPSSYHLFDESVNTIFLTEKKVKQHNKVQFEVIDFSASIPKQVCEMLYKHNLQSVIIEGGAQTLQSFIDENLLDEAYVFIGDVLFKEGLKAPKLKREPYKVKNVSNDTLKKYINIS